MDIVAVTKCWYQWIHFCGVLVQRSSSTQTKVERPPASNYYDSGQNVQQHSPQQPLAWQPDKDPCSCSETPNGARYSTVQRLKELENSEEFDMVVDVMCRLKT